MSSNEPKRKNIAVYVNDQKVAEQRQDTKLEEHQTICEYSHIPSDYIFKLDIIELEMPTEAFELLRRETGRRTLTYGNNKTPCYILWVRPSNKKGKYNIRLVTPTKLEKTPRAVIKII
jgi:hypothetical protein